MGKVRAADDLHCAIGQAHAAGLLEGERVDGRILLEHGREWLRLYRATYGGGVATANMERIGRARPQLRDTPADHLFAKWCAIIGRLSVSERHTLNLVCVEYGDVLELPPFLDRLINEQKVKHKVPVSGCLPTRVDREKLADLKAALLAITEGVRPARQTSVPSLAELTRPEGEAA